jgi:regulatory protein
MDLKTAIYRYCNYQERCHKQVRNKLYDLGATTTEVQQLITDVIEAGLLNEERYARSFARGKFRIKRWGRIKIRQHLKADQVSDYCIKKAMLEIDGDEYTTVLLRLAEKKWNELEREKRF